MAYNASGLQGTYVVTTCHLIIAAPPQSGLSPCVLTCFQGAPCHFGQQSVKSLVLLVNTGGIGSVVVVLSSKQRQVPNPAVGGHACGAMKDFGRQRMSPYQMKRLQYQPKLFFFHFRTYCPFFELVFSHRATQHTADHLVTVHTT